MGDSGPNLMLAPDARGRTLAAVFTAEDALEAYLKEMGANGKRGLEPLTIAGPRLFDLLPRISLDGFVFNCCGPVSPRAFAAAFARRVIEAADGESVGVCKNYEQVN